MWLVLVMLHNVLFLVVSVQSVVGRYPKFVFLDDEVVEVCIGLEGEAACDGVGGELALGVHAYFVQFSVEAHPYFSVGIEIAQDGCIAEGAVGLQ